MRAYPIRPADPDDPRFTFQLLLDIGRVLEGHGYPPLDDPMDLVGLRQGLYRFLYGEEA